MAEVYKFKHHNIFPPQQPDLEISLMTMMAGMMFNEESATQMRKPVIAGTFDFGVFKCKHLQATYEELKAKGVEFTKEPSREFYSF